MIRIEKTKKKVWIALVLAFLCTALLSSAVPKPETSRQDNDFWQVQPNEPNLLRLHVVANSNRQEDQLFKGKMVEEVQRLLADNGACWAAGEAAFTDENLPLLKEELQQYASLRGNQSPEIMVTLAKAEFPLRAYGRNIYPPGEYISLTVLIGEGMGDNWWCLLFPPLCLPMAEAKESPEPEAAADETDAGKQTFFSPDQGPSQKSQPGWRIKIFEQWGHWFGNN